MAVVATWIPLDATLDAVVPIGLAVAAGTAIVVDLDPTGPAIGEGPTLADLARRGPTADQLRPVRSGAAYLANGGIDLADAAEVVGALTERWPSVVLRCEARAPRPAGSVAFAPLLPPPHTLRLADPVVYQRTGLPSAMAPNGSLLPRPRRATVAGLLAGRRPPPRDRWIAALRDVWTAHA
jgi:hypothetical protein